MMEGRSEKLASAQTSPGEKRSFHLNICLLDCACPYYQLVTFAADGVTEGTFRTVEGSHGDGRHRRSVGLPQEATF